jgi:putative ABC transport system permease protein
MIKNYLTSAYRNIIKNRLFAIINIGGLAVGLAACILILLFVRDEVSYDSWLPGSDGIYRMHSTFTMPGRPEFKTVRSAGRIAYSVPDNVPEAGAVTRILQVSPTVLKDGDAFQEMISMVDPNFFDVFDLPFAEGSKETALPDLSSAVLSESMARKYFGDEPPIGQTLTLCCLANQHIEVRVTGVIRDIPRNSHLDLDLITLINREAFRNMGAMLESWTSVNVYTYFTLAEGFSLDELETGIMRLLRTNISIPENAPVSSVDEFYGISFISAADIHLEAREQASDMGDMRPLGDRTTLYALLSVAALVLAIASINFMNLASARATQRAREVSLRKVLGARRKQLIFQFIGESIIVTLMGFVLALALVELALPLYNDFLQRELALNFATEPSILAGLLAAALLIGVISGIYPAFVLSGFRPARILKANQSADPEGQSGIRLLLVVTQFAISIGLVVTTAVIYSQTSLVKSSSLGFEQENRLILRGLGRSAVADKQTALLNDILALPGVTSAAPSSDVPTDNFENTDLVQVLGQEEGGTIILNVASAGYGFMETYGIAPLFGRTFSREFGTDEFIASTDPEVQARATAVVNRSATRQLGFNRPEDALGALLSATAFGGDEGVFEIVGVVPDFRFRSFKYGVQPTYYVNAPSEFSSLTIAYGASENVDQLVGEIQAIWKQHAPSVPFLYEFMSETIRQQYASEDLQFTLFASFAGLAIFVACLGMFGLASYSAARRIKEIGLRKILGASVLDIVRLLVWQFSKPVLVANLVAWPVAGYFMMDWLQGFELRLSLEFVMFLFVAAGAMALFVAWATVAAQATSVARSSPIEALRYE